METHRSNIVPLVLLGHALVTALVWRDLARQPSMRVRGGKNLWRLLSAANTSGSLAYVLVGRRRA